MSHGAGDHHRHRHASRRRLALALGLTLAYMAAEFVGGMLTNSLALLADAGHMLADAGALGLSLFVTWVAARPGSARSTYGYYRAEILAALANGAALLTIALFILHEAIGRLRAPESVVGEGVTLVAAGGLVLNLLCLAILGKVRGDSLNIRGAWLHVASDAVGSVGALVSGLVVWTLGWTWADPVASLLICGLVVWSAWQLLRESVAVLMEGAPGHVDVDEIRTAMAAVSGVGEVHDLHVWTITSGLESLSGHVVARPGAAHGALLRELREVLEQRFGIRHVTIQVEPDERCGSPDHHDLVAESRDESRTSRS